MAYGIVLSQALLLPIDAHSADGAPAENRNLVWSGTLRIAETFSVPAGTTLEIRPGTRILFSKGSSLMVKGALKAVGRPGEEIVFSAAEKGFGGNWHELMLDGAEESVLEHCVIEYADKGVHSHDTKLTVAYCTVRNCEVGLRFRSGPLTVSRCRFTKNRIGVRSYQGIAKISESDFWDNEIGIFVREKGGGLQITGCNLFGNSAYNIRVGDFNDEDVKAPDNWWGTDDPAGTIFDASEEPEIGHVLFEPFRRERISWQ